MSNIEHEVARDIHPGDLVERAVYVGTERIPVGVGRVVSVHSGYCEVDVMGIHGGEPWLVKEVTCQLRKEHP